MEEREIEEKGQQVVRLTIVDHDGVYRLRRAPVPLARRPGLLLLLRRVLLPFLVLLASAGALRIAAILEGPVEASLEEARAAVRSEGSSASLYEASAKLEATLVEWGSSIILVIVVVEVPIIELAVGLLVGPPVLEIPEVLILVLLVASSSVVVFVEPPIVGSVVIASVVTAASVVLVIVIVVGGFVLWA